ncbi:MAG: hypothetical protein QW412_00730 [Candidatus Aenigmatarchaeota archaeon]
MEFERIVFLVLVVILGMTFLLSTTRQAFSETSNQTNVTVEVKGVCQITVAPTNHTWFSVTPGTEGNVKTLNIINSGSKNLTNIYAYVDTIEKEVSNPIPLGVPSAYASGGVLVLKTTGNFFYVGRLEWNVTKPVGAGGTNCQNAATWGWYRNATVGNYLWCMVNSSDGTCNGTNAAIYIETDPDNGEQNTREPDNGGSISPKENWGLYNFLTGPLSGHCVAIYKDCTKMYIYKYDKRTDPSFGDCTGTSYIRETTLTPSSEFSVDLNVWVPEGIPAGWLASSWLTIEGTCPA